MGPLDVIVVDSHQLQMVLYGNRPIVDIVALHKLATSKKWYNINAYEDLEFI
mgnify:CR=1 FL=1